MIPAKSLRHWKANRSFDDYHFGWTWRFMSHHLLLNLIVNLSTIASGPYLYLQYWYRQSFFKTITLCSVYLKSLTFLFFTILLFCKETYKCKIHITFRCFILGVRTCGSIKPGPLILRTDHYWFWGGLRYNRNHCNKNTTS